MITGQWVLCKSFYFRAWGGILDAPEGASQTFWKSDRAGESGQGSPPNPHQCKVAPQWAQSATGVVFSTWCGRCPFWAVWLRAGGPASRSLCCSVFKDSDFRKTECSHAHGDVVSEGVSLSSMPALPLPGFLPRPLGGQLSAWRPFYKTLQPRAPPQKSCTLPRGIKGQLWEWLFSSWATFKKPWSFLTWHIPESLCPVPASSVHNRYVALCLIT